MNQSKVIIIMEIDNTRNLQMSNRNWTDDMEIEFKYVLAKHILSRM